MAIWHTRNERAAIKRRGGRPLRKYGYDGTIRGRPCEVREARKDTRFRIQRNTHQALVRRGGSYILKSGKKTRRVSAKRVSKLIGRGIWFKDRSYPHKFLRKSQVF